MKGGKHIAALGNLGPREEILASKRVAQSAFAVSDRLKAVVLAQDIFEFVSSLVKGKNLDIRRGSYSFKETRIDQHTSSIGIEYTDAEGDRYSMAIKPVNLVRGQPEEGQEGLVIKAGKWTSDRECTEIYFANTEASNRISEDLHDNFNAPLSDIRMLMPPEIAPHKS